MNSVDRNRWKSAILDEIFIALAASSALNECLIYKGAKALDAHIGTGRQSLDIDSNLTFSFVQRFPNRAGQGTYLEREIALAVRRHFEHQTPVRYMLASLRVKSHPPLGHAMAWDAFVAHINVEDLSKPIRGLPALRVDIAAPEQLIDSSVTTIAVAGRTVKAYTLERIAGEKLRAFLSSLPGYIAKVKRPREEAKVRVKDLYDMVRIQRVRTLDDSSFWSTAGNEFHIACRSRYVDCLGIQTFHEGWDVTRGIYERSSLEKEIAFSETAVTLESIVQYWEHLGVIPFEHPLPVDAIDRD